MIETLEFLDTILIYIILSQYTMKQYQYVFFHNLTWKITI